MEMKITLGGNKKVDAHVGTFVIHTDQSVRGGGDETAPEPYTLFLASIGTCAGIYVVFFCEARKIPIDGIELTQRLEFENVDGARKLRRVVLEISVPPSFPEKYRDAVARAAASCAVKKTIADPPEFSVTTVVAAPSAVPAT
jgi:ribosomal protein S12 methylthiotransferase accessory factor